MGKSYFGRTDLSHNKEIIIELSNYSEAIVDTVDVYGYYICTDVEDVTDVSEEVLLVKSQLCSQLEHINSYSTKIKKS